MEIPCEVLSGRPERHFHDPELLLFQGFDRLLPQRALFTDQAVIQIVAHSAKEFLQVAKIQNHAPHLPLADEFLRLQFHHRSPAVTVQVAALSGISFQKMSRVKTAL